MKIEDLIPEQYEFEDYDEPEMGHTYLDFEKITRIRDSTTWTSGPRIILKRKYIPKPGEIFCAKKGNGFYLFQKIGESHAIQVGESTNISIDELSYLRPLNSIEKGEE